MKRVRILHHDTPVSGRLEGSSILLDDGSLIAESDARYLAPVQPTKILATHLSYRSRAKEFGIRQVPDTPSYFLKPLSSLSYHRAPVARPHGCQFLNYEGEIAVVIGKRCSGVSIEDAPGYVAGYTVANDWGIHDFHHADRGSLLRVKGQDGFCPLGPALVDAQEVDPDAFILRTYVNGKLVQEASVREDLMFPFAYMVADLSRLITLEPGDVLLTGTPANSRPVEIGDVVAVEVEGLGRLENTVVELERNLSGPGVQPAVTVHTLTSGLGLSQEQAAQELQARAGKG
ncbi:MAG TPA: fumarylacetoacetate hydrolase family protein [Ktedonobacteraceae bacterium]|nr:fumarylacetoacetate hydrolase family protein [Ktedonobacteraceae bacterium]